MNEVKAKLDWQRIHQQLADNRQALDGRLALDEQQAKQRLRQRAEELARRGADERQSAPLRRVFVFTLGEQRFAIDLACVTKVARLDKYVPVPGGPPELLGVANVDGELRSILNLRSSLGIEAPEDVRPAYAFLLRRGQTELGVAADAIVEVAEFREDEIRQPDKDATTALNSAAGIGPSATVLLDVDKLFGRASDEHPPS